MKSVADIQPLAIIVAVTDYIDSRQHGNTHAETISQLRAKGRVMEDWIDAINYTNVEFSESSWPRDVREAIRTSDNGKTWEIRVKGANKNENPN